MMGVADREQWLRRVLYVEKRHAAGGARSGPVRDSGGRLGFFLRLVFGLGPGEERVNAGESTLAGGGRALAPMRHVHIAALLYHEIEIQRRLWP